MQIDLIYECVLIQISQGAKFMGPGFRVVTDTWNHARTQWIVFKQIPKMGLTTPYRVVQLHLGQFLIQK